MKILHAGDLHIDSPMRGLTEYDGAPVGDVRSATRRAVSNLVTSAIDHKVDLVVLAGDIFDGDWKDYNTGLFWVSELVRLEEVSIPVVFVSGNHDAASEISRNLRLPGNVRHLSSTSPQTIVFDNLDVAVVGQSYPTRSVSTDLVSAFPVADPGLFTIGLHHTSLDGRTGHASYAPTNVSILRSKGYQYWALGHVHTREVVAQDPWIVFPGNLQGRHVRECGDKGASLLTVIDGELGSVEHLSLDVVRWHNIHVDVSSATGIDDALGLIAKSLANTSEATPEKLVAARITLSGRSQAHRHLWKHRNALEAEIRASGISLGSVWIEGVRIQTLAAESEPVVADASVLYGVRQVIDGLRVNPASLERLEAVCAPLRTKLAAEVRDWGEEELGAADFGSAQHLAELLEGSYERLSGMLTESDE